MNTINTKSIEGLESTTMRPPCESIVKRVLPTVRSILVKELSDEYGLSQSEIANKLAITQPAVSQYLSSARGKGKLKKSLKKTGLYPKLKKLAKEIAEGSIKREQIVKKYCEVCTSMRSEEVLCAIHAENAPLLSEEECKICLETKDEQS